MWFVDNCCDKSARTHILTILLRGSTRYTDSVFIHGSDRSGCHWRQFFSCYAWYYCVPQKPYPSVEIWTFRCPRSSIFFFCLMVFPLYRKTPLGPADENRFPKIVAICLKIRKRCWVACGVCAKKYEELAISDGILQ